MAGTSLNNTLFHEDYISHFSPLGYLDGYWKNIQPAGVQFLLDNTYDYMRKVPSSACRFLDLGCGPNLSGVLPAPDHFDQIVMADFTKANLDIIRRFLRDDDVDFDWNHVCQHYTTKYDLKSDWGKQRMTSLKHYIKEIRSCDVQQPDPLGPAYRHYFDCVFSSFCLEVASRDFETYCKSVTNVASLIQDRGFLILRGILGESNYPVSGKLFHTLPLTWDQLITAQQEAGFEVVKGSSHPVGEEIEGTYFTVLSQKSS